MNHNNKRLLLILLGFLAVVAIALTVAFTVSDSGGSSSSSSTDNLRGSENGSDRDGSDTNNDVNHSVISSISVSSSPTESPSVIDEAPETEEVIEDYVDGNVVSNSGGAEPPNGADTDVIMEGENEPPVYYGTIAEGPWPQCVGLTVAECVDIITNDTQDISPVQIVPVEDGMFVTMDYDLNRVRIWYIKKGSGREEVVEPVPRRK